MSEEDQVAIEHFGTSDMIVQIYIVALFFLKLFLQSMNRFVKIAHFFFLLFKVLNCILNVWVFRSSLVFLLFKLDPSLFEGLNLLVDLKAGARFYLEECAFEVTKSFSVLDKLFRNNVQIELSDSITYNLIKLLKLTV